MGTVNGHSRLGLLITHILILVQDDYAAYLNHLPNIASKLLNLIVLTRYHDTNVVAFVLLTASTTLSEIRD